MEYDFHFSNDETTLLLELVRLEIAKIEGEISVSNALRYVDLKKLEGKLSGLIKVYDDFPVN